VTAHTLIADITPLDDLDQWVRGSGLEIVLLVVGAMLLGRFIPWLRDRIIARIDARPDDTLVTTEERKHRKAVVQIVAWVAVVVLWTVTGVLVLIRFGVPYASLVAPLAAGGVALGLGAQRLVGDLIGGSFIIAERQYGLGDLIEIAPTPQTAGATGTVEELTLRITRLRTASGERVVIPNGQIVQVTNLSSDWARAVVDVPVPLGSDVARATETLRQVGQDAFADEHLQPLLLDAPTVMGVESFAEGQVQLRIVARSVPGRQFEVARQLRARIAEAFQREGFAANAEASAAPPASET